MRLMVLLAAVLFSGNAAALDPATFRLTTGHKLVELCGLPADDPLYVRAMEFCNGYLTGSYHYYVASTLAPGRFVCSPNPPPAPADVIKGFIAWAKSNQQYLDERPVDSLFRYLGGAYPCKN